MRFRKRERKDAGKDNVKRLFRRNQIVITTLAVMIAAAGYLNYAGKEELEGGEDSLVYEAGSRDISEEDLYQENLAAYEMEGEIEEAESLAEIDSWDAGEEISNETGIDNPGEAVLTNGMTVSDYIAGVQLNREQIRARNKETLNNIINNSSIEASAKQEAIQNMITMTEIAEKENAAETLLQAKGFADPVVSLSEGKVDVVINAAAISDQERAQIEDIVKRKTMVTADSIVITLLNLEE